MEKTNRNKRIKKIEFTLGLVAGIIIYVVNETCDFF